MNTFDQGQAAVIAFDQPIYGLAKEIQWRYPNTMGEDKLVVMLGGLLIELAVLKAIGSWLLGSGWTEAIAQARITTTGRAESLVTSTHIHYTYEIHPSSYGILNRDPTRITTQNPRRTLLHSPNGTKIMPARSHSSNSGI